MKKKLIIVGMTALLILNFGIAVLADSNVQTNSSTANTIIAPKGDPGGHEPW